MDLIKLNEKFQPLIECDESIRYFLVTGGRGSAKSFGVGSFTCALSFEVGHKILFTRYTMTSAGLSVIPEFQEKIELMDALPFFDITKNEIKNLRSNSEILFRGIKTSSGDQTASLKSLQAVTTWVLDEAEELVDEGKFDKIDLSIRAKRKHNRIILILNPATKEHWIYKRFFEKKGVQEGFNGVKDNICYIHTSYLDNKKHLNDSFLERVENIKLTNPEKYNHIILGGWLNKAEGVVFTNWRLGEFNPDNLQTSFGQDYGFTVDPTTLIEVATDNKNKKIYVKQHIYKTNLTTSEIADLNNVTAGKSLIWADSAEPRLIEELRRKGNNIKAVSKVKIEERVSFLQDYEIIVDIESTDIVKELNNYVYTDKTSKMYIDAYNHALDAIGYNVTGNIIRPKMKVTSSGIL